MRFEGRLKIFLAALCLRKMQKARMLDRFKFIVRFKAVCCIPQITLIALVNFYRLFLSPMLGASCRFEPTCSAYALKALQNKGAVVGTYLTLHRLARCNPWCDGGCDPVVFKQPCSGSSLFCNPAGPQKPSSSSEKNLS